MCQSQSLNLFLPGDVHKRDLHRLHMLAWKKGVKSLYYCRSKSIQRAESAATGTARVNGAAKAQGAQAIPLLGKVNGHEQAKGQSGEGNGAGAPSDYEECLACQ